MVERQVTILNRYGLHVRPSTQFSQTAGEFESHITVTVPDGRTIDGSSLLELLGLGVQGGTQITIRAEGQDEQQAIDKLCGLVAKQFGLKYDE